MQSALSELSGEIRPGDVPACLFVQTSKAQPIQLGSSLSHLSPTGSVSHQYEGKNMTQGDIPDCPFLFDRHSQRHAEFSICRSVTAASTDNLPSLKNQTSFNHERDDEKEGIDEIASRAPFVEINFPHGGTRAWLVVCGVS